MIPVTIIGHTYKSISAARREVGSDVPEITIRWRLKHGWDPVMAFFTPVVPPEDRRTFAEVRATIDEAAV